MANDDVRRLLILTFEKTRFLCGFPVRVAGRCGGGDVTALSCFIFDPMCHPLFSQNPVSPHTPQKCPTAASGCRAGVFVCLPPSPATQGEPGGQQAEDSHITQKQITAVPSQAGMCCRFPPAIESCIPTDSDPSVPRCSGSSFQSSTALPCPREDSCTPVPFHLSAPR